jgi:predicted GH43/DUF377 family glycosyl hydrolase
MTGVAVASAADATGPALVRRSAVELQPDKGRVIARSFLPGQEMLLHGISRAESVMERLLAMSEQDVSRTLTETQALYLGRHPDLRSTFREHFDMVAHRLPQLRRGEIVSQDRKDLIGAYFTQEYAVEGAALFNPSIVVHPDQSGCAASELRFIMGLRAVGEGHISSVEFRTGTLGANDAVALDSPAQLLTTGHVTPHPMSADFLRASLEEQGDAFAAESVLRLLPGRFTPQELEEVLASSEQDSLHRHGDDGLLERIRRTASSSYQLDFGPERDLSERVIFPNSAAESHGIEDVRLVQFVGESGDVTYYGTYTAYDGSRVVPHLLQTYDFQTFTMAPMIGAAAQNKGMALFPRRIGGDMWCLSRWDRENISVARSPDAIRWGRPQTVQRPTKPWELIQLGVCASPLETPYGWLVLTHGVGPMRTYGMGALLLDLDDPTVVLGVLDEPLLTPTASERDGYVPNVVYSCGALIHRSTVVLPYGCSDASVRIAFIDLAELIERLLNHPPPAVRASTCA